MVTQQPTRIRWSRWAYAIVTTLVSLAVVVQVFLAGMAVFDDSSFWKTHTSFVHFFELLPLLTLILAFIGRVTIASRWGTFAVFVLIIGQYFTANSDAPIAALHPVNALFVFAVSLWLTWRAWSTELREGTLESAP